jgi:hypothetical protein
MARAQRGLVQVAQLAQAGRWGLVPTAPLVLVVVEQALVLAIDGEPPKLSLVRGQIPKGKLRC